MWNGIHVWDPTRSLTILCCIVASFTHLFLRALCKCPQRAESATVGRSEGGFLKRPWIVQALSQRHTAVTVLRSGRLLMFTHHVSGGCLKPSGRRLTMGTILRSAASPLPRHQIISRFPIEFLRFSVPGVQRPCFANLTSSTTTLL